MGYVICAPSGRTVLWAKSIHRWKKSSSCGVLTEGRWRQKCLKHEAHEFSFTLLQYHGLKSKSFSHINLWRNFGRLTQDGQTSAVDYSRTKDYRRNGFMFQIRLCPEKHFPTALWERTPSATYVQSLPVWDVEKWYFGCWILLKNRRARKRLLIEAIRFVWTILHVHLNRLQKTLSTTRLRHPSQLPKNWRFRSQIRLPKRMSESDGFVKPKKITENL